MDIDPDKWLQDSISEDFTQLHRIEEVLYSGQTQYQSVRIVRTGGFGLCLILDGKIQSSQADEFIYHEALVHPAMITHPNPETVFIAGGGEGATLREALSHNTVKRAVMVDIDEEVIALCKEYLPDHNRGAFADSRTELYHVDARKYLENSSEQFDIIVIDLPDPIEEGPAYRLYTKEFYNIVSDRLGDDGLITVQAGSASYNELLNLTAVNNTLNSVFPIVTTHQVDVPCFGGPWGFCIASRKYNPGQLTADEINERISQRSLTGLNLYDGITHTGMFSLPLFLRNALSSQQRIITDEEPLYLYSG